MSNLRLKRNTDISKALTNDSYSGQLLELNLLPCLTFNIKVLVRKKAGKFVCFVLGQGNLTGLPLPMSG